MKSFAYLAALCALSFLSTAEGFDPWNDCTDGSTEEACQVYYR